jgi:hypothetical protein
VPSPAEFLGGKAGNPGARQPREKEQHMSIIVIDGKRLDTGKAKQSWDLSHHDGSNYHSGRLYLSSGGTWYVETPSQWANGHRWELCDPVEAIERYGEGLGDDDRAEILRRRASRPSSAAPADPAG